MRAIMHADVGKMRDYTRQDTLIYSALLENVDREAENTPVQVATRLVCIFLRSHLTQVFCKKTSICYCHLIK